MGIERIPYPALLEPIISFPLDSWLSNIQQKYVNFAENQEYLAIMNAVNAYDESTENLNLVQLSLPRIMLVSSLENTVGGDARYYCDKGAVLFVRTQNDAILFEQCTENFRTIRYFHFFTIVRWSNRGKLACDECGTHNSHCMHCKIVKLLVDDDDGDNIGGNKYREARSFDRSCKIPIPLSRALPFSENHDMEPIKFIFKLNIIDFPSELIPFKRIVDKTLCRPVAAQCFCLLGVSLPLEFCPCQIKCKICGSDWDMNPLDDGVAVVYLPTTYVKTQLKCFQCSNAMCRNKRCYNGHGDGLIVLYKNEHDEKVIINAYNMIIIAEDIFKNSMSISNQYEKVCLKYLLVLH